MKRQQPETNTQPNSDTESQLKPKRQRLSLGRKVVAITTALVASGAGIAGGLAATSSSKTSKNANAASTKALDKELLNAYDGPVKITSAKVVDGTSKTTDSIGVERGTVKINIAGGTVNQETADSKGTPSYFYAAQPNEYLDYDGKKIRGEVSWLDQKNGIAEMQPDLSFFQASRPATRDYEIDLGVWGMDSPVRSSEEGQAVEAFYNAGTVAITGVNSQLTIAQVVPRPESEPAVRIVLPPKGVIDFKLSSY